MECLGEDPRHLTTTEYEDYVQLYAAFTQYLPNVRFGNRPVLVKGVYEIPRLQILLVEMKKDQTKNAKEITRIKEYEAYQSNLWNAFDQVVEALSENKYVLSRMLKNSRPISYVDIKAAEKHDYPYDQTYASDLVRPPHEGVATALETNLAKERIKEMLYALVPG